MLRVGPLDRQESDTTEWLIIIIIIINIYIYIYIYIYCQIFGSKIILANPHIYIYTVYIVRLLFLFNPVVLPGFPYLVIFLSLFSLIIILITCSLLFYSLVPFWFSIYRLAFPLFLCPVSRRFKWLFSLDLP